MANKVLNRVWEASQQRGAARCLIAVLADVADAHGIAYPGIPYLANMINETEDYTYKLLRKLIEDGEILHRPGGGRGRKTLYAVVVGLNDGQRTEVNTVLQSRVYYEKPGKKPASNPALQNSVLQNTVLQNTVLERTKPCTFPDSKQTAFSAFEPPEPSIPKNMIHDHDPVGGVGVDGRTLAFLIDQGLNAAEEFEHLPYDSMRADYDARRADGQTNGSIVRAWRRNPPTKDYHYEQQRPRSVQSNAAPDRRRPSERLGERPTLPPGLKLASSASWKKTDSSD